MYCTVADLIARFSEREIIELTDRDYTGAVNQSIAEAAIADASATIDGYLAGRYSLPLNVVPVVLVRLCANLARYNLYDNTLPETVSRNQQDAIRYLEQVAKGVVTLGLDDAQQAAQTDDSVSFESAPSVWRRDASQGFI